MSSTSEIKDSGERTLFSTGAVRDCQKGKGRFDWVPLDVLGQVLDDRVIGELYYFQTTGHTEHLFHALDIFFSMYPGGKYAAALGVAKHYEAGCEKYGLDNWKKGLPISRYIDSACRHYCKYRAGWTDEPHDNAFIWNIMGAIWTKQNIKEQDASTEEVHIC